METNRHLNDTKADSSYNPHYQDSNDLRYRWMKIFECKNNFLQQNEDPYRCPCIRHEVAESWIRSRKYGVSPHTKSVSRINPKKFAKIEKHNRLLIETTSSLFDLLRLKDFIVSSRYALYLFDQNGVLIFHEGIEDDMQQIVGDYGGLPGTIWTEEIIGTCAHSLCVQLKSPVQLMGPEHYCDIFDYSNVSAVPIVDEGEVIAALVLSQHLTDTPLQEGFNSNYLDLSSHAMGLATAMGAAIENKFKLRRSYDQLKVSHSVVKTTLSVIDEGIITVDVNGSIVHINKEGSRILNLENTDLNNKNINEYLSNQSSLMGLISKGINTDIEENILVGNEEQSYIISIRNVIDTDTKQVDAAVLKLISTEKINAIVANRSGAKASFHFEDIIGDSKEMQKAIAIGRRFSISPENVLLIGESGTGKELFAQAIHSQHRPNGPFMAINCAAMPRELIESELFGYEGGSFTGAERNGRPGKIELAHGGTLFLDEIGDMPFELQAVLLRVLEDKQVMRIGGRRYKKVDFRIIAATNKDLYQMVSQNLFREDLFYRLSVLSINLPPLRQRGNDVELLCKYFINNYCLKLGWKAPKISKAAMMKIVAYQWPGNVRQLQNAIIYAVNTTQNDTIEAEDLPAVVLGGNPANPNNKAWGEIHSIEEMEKIVIENALAKANNNVTKTAQLLGMAKSTLYRKLKEYNISTDEDD